MRLYNYTYSTILLITFIKDIYRTNLYVLNIQKWSHQSVHTNGNFTHSQQGYTSHSFLKLPPWNDRSKNPTLCLIHIQTFNEKMKGNDANLREPECWSDDHIN